MSDVVFAHNGGHMEGRRYAVAASDVIASFCAGYRPCCVVLIVSCPRRRRAPRLDDFIVPWVPGAEAAIHDSLFYYFTTNIWSFYQMGDVGLISWCIIRKLYKIQVLTKNKAGFLKSFNSVFGKIGRSAPEEVLFELIKSTC